MAAFVRTVHLSLAARVRSIGWAPWLMLLGWLVIAAAQEPVLLRRYGIHLLDDAGWSGGVVMLCILLAAEPRWPRRYARRTSIALLLLVAAVVTVLDWALDRAWFAAGLLARGWQIAAFTLAWAPLALTACRAVPPGEVRASRIPPWRILLVLAGTLWLGSILSVALRPGPELGPVLAGLIATAGASLLPVAKE